MEFDSRNFDSSTTDLANCHESVQAWMGNNKLKLSPDKSESTVIGDDQIRSSLKSSLPISFLAGLTVLSKVFFSHFFIQYWTKSEKKNLS